MKKMNFLVNFGRGSDLNEQGCNAQLEGRNLGGKCAGDCQGRMFGVSGGISESQVENVSGGKIICATLVNTQTHTDI